LVRAVAWADSTRAAPSHLLPLRGLPGAVFASGLVVAWAESSPGRESVRGAEHAHVAAGLGDDHFCGAAGDAGDGHEPVELVAKGLEPVVDLRGEPGAGGVGGVDAGQHLADQDRVVGVESTQQRLLQLGRLAAQRGASQPGQHDGIALSVDQRVEHRSAGDTDDAGGDRAKFDAGVFEVFLQPLHFPGAFLDDRLAVAGQVPQLADRWRGNEGWADQPVLDQLRDPFGVLDVGLAAGHHP
jgi:hypothetical protein